MTKLTILQRKKLIPSLTDGEHAERERGRERGERETEGEYGVGEVLR